MIYSKKQKWCTQKSRMGWIKASGKETLAWGGGTGGALWGGDGGVSKSQSREVFTGDEASVVPTGPSVTSASAKQELFQERPKQVSFSLQFSSR